MGGKRAKVDTNLQTKKCGERSFVGDDDRISQLPDEILVDILSLLCLKEAARTSVFSSRWMNLWKHTTSLNFESDRSLYRKFCHQEELLENEKHKYVTWVNSVIRSHKSLTLQEFRVDCHLSNSSSDAITRWFEFALSRQVQRLELSFRNYCKLSEYYCFPDKFLTLSTRRTSTKLQPPSDSFGIHHHPGIHVGFKSLKTLVLSYVGVNDGDIDFFLRNCPLLEQLIVRNSGHISEPEVSGSSLKLKHLEIAKCSCLESLKVISVPRLTTVKVPTNFTGLLLENVPMLVNISVRCYDRNTSVKPLFDVLSSCTSQLETLRLELMSITLRGQMPELCELPEMPKLKKLVIQYDASGHESLIRLAALIRVSPSLEEFVLEYNWHKLPRKDREVKVPMRSPHHHLKVFKFRGYYGSVGDVELLSYILENCVALEKIIIDVDPRFISESEGKLEVEETARKNAKQKLAPQVPQHIELVIL